MFQGEPFAKADYDKAIKEVWEAIKKYAINIRVRR